MDGGDDLGAVADRGGDALDRADAHVADGEDAAAAGLERQAVLADLVAGQDEAALVELEPEPRSQSVLGSAPMKENR